MFEQKYKKQLEVQVKSKEFIAMFETLRKTNPILNLYPTTDDLCELLKPGNQNYEHKDKVMAVLVQELHHSNTVYPLINLMFWNSLHRLYWQRKSRVPDPEMLFGRIQWDFYHALMNHNLERLPRKIDVNVFLNTKKKVIAWEKENIGYKKAIQELRDLCQSGIAPEDINASTVYPVEMEGYLLDMVYRKIINTVQYDLILETLVYKNMNQREWAEKTGVSYNTVRSLRYRAELAIRGFEMKKSG